VSTPRPPRLLISIGGGIAAYKVCTVISSLFQQGIEVRVVLTESAQNFITPLTVSTLARQRAYTDADFWAASDSFAGTGGYRPLHIELGEWADLILVAPLTANTLGKLTHGLADNLLTNTVLASTCPVLLAPAMNTDMWEQMAVQRNYQLLETDPRYHWCNLGEGLLACDRVGKGRMAEPEAIITHLQSLLISGGKRDLLGQEILVSTGGTKEFLDPVRFLGNPATGKMGLAIAQAAAHRGATVKLVYGNLPGEPIAKGASRAIEPNIQLISTPTSDRMAAALFEHFPSADITFMAAAVADVRPANYSNRKLAKQEIPTAIPVLDVLDIAAELGRRKQSNQKLIGFAAQTGDIVTPAQAKLERKNLDAIVANPIDLPQAGFGSDHNQAVWIDRAGQQVVISHCSKLEMAHKLLDLSQLLNYNES
jgi:phosphopantothenoylcysteine decarboxylase / phosphopantothenate---cysteine ligase